MDLRKSKILVTGADGFIGSHLVERLVARGYDVRAFVAYNSLGSWGWLDKSSAKLKDELDVVLGDIRDRNSIRDAMRGCEVVLNLAALISIPYSYLAPTAYVDTNLVGTINVLDAARDLGIARVVQTSTSEVYGTAQFVPITEEHPLNAQSPYAASKVASDQMALAYHRSFECPVAIIRPFNTYGPRQSVRAVIPTIIAQLMAGETTIRLGNLTATRDFTFVEDTADGFIRVAETDACIGDVVNIGSGFEISIGDLVNEIARVAGKQVEIVQEGKRMRPANSEVERLFAGIEKAERLFAWKPEHGGVDGFRKGLAKTVAWFSDPANLAHYTAGRFLV